jgi:hypothetical protein
MNENLESFGSMRLFGQNLVGINFDSAEVRKMHLQSINLESYRSANQPGLNGTFARYYHTHHYWNRQCLIAEQSYEVRTSVYMKDGTHYLKTDDVSDV